MLAPPVEGKPVFRHPFEDLKQISAETGIPLNDSRFAKLMDERDPLKDFRSEFNYPKMGEILNSG